MSKLLGILSFILNCCLIGYGFWEISAYPNDIFIVVLGIFTIAVSLVGLSFAVRIITDS